MDPYAILGVPASATDDEISAAYRRLARKYHPDLNGNSREAEEKMKEVNAAYEKIRDLRSGKSTPGADAGGTQTPYGRYGQSAYGENGEDPFENFDPFDIFRTFGGYGTYRPNRTYRRTYRTPFSFLRLLLTLFFLSFLLRGCMLLPYLVSYPANVPERPGENQSQKGPTV